MEKSMKNFYLNYFRDLKLTLDKIDLNMFKKINESLFFALENEKHIFTMGNGGSATTASHLVCDLNKGVCFGRNIKFKAICLNDNVPTILAYSNDVSYSDIFLEQLKNFLNKGDIVIGISCSGNSENILRAIEFSNKKDGVTIGFSGYDGGKLSKIAKYPIIVPIADMQKCEDIHLILCHLIMQTMNNLLKKKANG
jgi:D-sedoheptulose 7-phosphate isomerase